MQVWTTMAQLTGKDTTRRPTGVNDGFDFGGVDPKSPQVSVNPEQAQVNIAKTEEKLSDLGSKITSLVDEKLAQSELYDGDSKILASKAKIKFTEEDRDTIKEYIQLLNSHKLLTGNDDYATGEKSQPIMEKLSVLLRFNSDDGSLREAQRFIFQKQKVLIESHTKLPNLSSKVNASASDIRSSIFSILNPDLNPEERINLRTNLANALILSVGIDNFSSNSSVNGQSVGIFTAVEKMFSLGGGEDNSVGKAWLDTFKAALAPTFVDSLDTLVESAEVDSKTLDTIKSIREKASRLVIDQLNADTKLQKLAEGRKIASNGKNTEDRTTNLKHIIEAFEKSYTIGEEKEFGQTKNWNDEFHYQIAKLGFSFAETAKKLTEAEMVLKQLKDIKSKDPITLIRDVPVDQLSSDNQLEVLAKTLTAAFDEYKLKNERLTTLGADSGKYKITGYSLLRNLEGGDGSSKLATKNGDTYSITVEGGNKVSLSSRNYEYLAKALKADETKTYAGNLSDTDTVLVNLLKSVEDTHSSSSSTTTLADSDKEQIKNFLKAAINKSKNQELEALRQDIASLDAPVGSNKESDSDFTAVLTKLNGGTVKKLSDFTTERELKAFINVSDTKYFTKNDLNANNENLRKAVESLLTEAREKSSLVNDPDIVNHPDPTPSQLLLVIDSCDASISDEDKTSIRNSLRAGNNISDIINSAAEDKKESYGTYLNALVAHEKQTTLIASRDEAITKLKNLTGDDREVNVLSGELIACGSQNKLDVLSIATFSKVLQNEANITDEVLRDNLGSYSEGSNRSTRDIQGALHELGSKVLIKLTNSDEDKTLASNLRSAFDLQKKAAQEQQKDDIKFRTQLSTAFTKAVQGTGFISMAAHQADLFIKRFTSEEGDAWVIDSDHIESIFQHKSILSESDSLLGVRLMAEHNQSHRMGKSVGAILDNEQSDALKQFLEQPKNKAGLDDLRQDSNYLLSTGSEKLPGSASLRDVITQVLDRAKDLKNLDPRGFSFSPDAQAMRDMLRNYKEHDSLSEAKAKLALRKTLNSMLSAIQKYSGQDTEIITLKSNLADNRVEVISGKRADKFIEEANAINNKYDNLRINLDARESWGKAGNLEMVLNAEQEGAVDKLKVGHNTVVDLLKVLVNMFRGSREDSLMAYQQHANERIKTDTGKTDNPLQDLITLAWTDGRILSAK